VYPSDTKRTTYTKVLKNGIGKNKKRFQDENGTRHAYDYHNIPFIIIIIIIIIRTFITRKLIQNCKWPTFINHFKTYFTHQHALSKPHNAASIIVLVRINLSYTSLSCSRLDLMGCFWLQLVIQHHQEDSAGGRECLTRQSSHHHLAGAKTHKTTAESLTLHTDCCKSLFMSPAMQQGTLIIKLCKSKLTRDQSVTIWRISIYRTEIQMYKRQQEDSVTFVIHNAINDFY